LPRYASVDAYRDRLAVLTGGEAAETALADWIAAKEALVGDEAFALNFEPHFDRFEAETLDYAHRRFEVGSQAALGGIRFLGGDPTRPFVDVFAWSGSLDVRELSHAVATNWAAFSPFALRLIAVPDWRVDGAYRDQSIHAARVGDMAGDPGPVSLRSTEDIDAALTLVEEKFASFRADDPGLAAAVYPANRELLSDSLATGTLHEILVDGEVAGLIATEAGNLEFIESFIVTEEVVLDRFNGRGVAAAAQAALARELAMRDPAATLSGTIDGRNHASRKSAERAGRPVVFEYFFVDL